MTCTSMPRVCSHRQPKAVASRLIGKSNPLNQPAALYPLGSPTLQQSLQCCGMRVTLLQWSTINAGNQAGDQPTRLAHLDDRYQRGVLVQFDEGTAQIIDLG